MSGRIRVTWAGLLVGWMAFGSASLWAGEAAAPAADAKPADEKAKPSAAPAAAELTDAQIEQLAKQNSMTSAGVRLTLAFMKNYKPIQARDLPQLLDEKNQPLRYTFRETSSYARQLETLRTSDPERYKRQEQTYRLGARADLLAERYNQAAEAEKPRVEEELVNVLAQLFDLRVEDERAQVEALRKQADELEQRIKTRAANKDRIVDRQVTTRLGIDEILVW